MVWSVPLIVRNVVTVWDKYSFALSVWNRSGDLPCMAFMYRKVLGIIAASSALDLMGIAIMYRE